MRSHSFAALALLFSTSALAACGESVAVGTFEDGTGGAGGGEPVTTGGPASGTGGDEPTSSSTGGQGAAPPDAFHLFALQLEGDDAVLLQGEFARGGASNVIDCVAVQTIGSCTLSDCHELDVEQRVTVDAGVASVSVGDDAVTATYDTASPYFSYNGDTDIQMFEGGETARFAVSGSADVPTFATDLDAPPAAENLQQLFNLFGAPTGEDFTFRWTPSPGLENLSLSLSSGTREDGNAKTLRCELDPGTGELEIPGELIVAADQGVNRGVSFSTLRTGVTVGTFEGMIAVIRLVSTSSRCGGLGPEGENVCADDEYCDWSDDSCGGDDGTGVCRPRPASCETNGPVTCACNGESYPSACEAAQHGADVWGGEDLCPAPTVCGGIGGIACEADQFCDFPNDQCGGDDSTGVCRPRPTDCPEPNADEAVCGCTFGDSFGSECLANQAGQDIAPGDGLECGGA